MQIRTYPNELRGVIDDRLYKRIEDLYNMIYDLQAQLQQHQVKTTNPKISNAQMKQIRDSLQVKGSMPLNIQGLLGVPPGNAIEFDSFPDPRDPRSQDGALGVLSSTGALYRYSNSTRSWNAVP